MTEPELIARRTAVAALAEALRAVTRVAVISEAPIDALERATELARRLQAELQVRTRGHTELASVDDPPKGFRFFGPVIGAGSPLSPPLTLLHTADGVDGRVTLDQRFEGPVGFAHGGVAGLLLDELLGQTAIDAGRWGMTARLDIAYRQPLPLDEELMLRGRVTGHERRKTFITGTVARAADPEVVCVRAEGLFVMPSEETYRRYFGGVVDASGGVADVRFGRAAD